MKRCTTCLAVLLLMTLGASSWAQWSEGAGPEQPRYLLFAKEDGSFLIVRFSDWATETIKVPGAPSHSAFFLGVMEEKPIAIALTINSNYTQDELYLEVINLQTKQVTLLSDPEKQTHIGKHINMVFMTPDDPDHVYVLFSNKYNYGSVEYAFAPNYAGEEWIMARLQPETMEWEVPKNPPTNHEQLDPIPVGGILLPYMYRLARQQGANKDNMVAVKYKIVADLAAQLHQQGILKAPSTSMHRNLLFQGEKYQFVWREGTYALVKTENGKSVIVSECTKEKAKELGFEKDVENFKADATTALVVPPLKWF